MIEKKIHYCWFGSKKKPKLARKCIKSWKKYCKDFQFIEWNEKKFDIDSSPLYVREAYRLKKWAFVTDYVRLWVIYKFGGVYFDTDVELIKPIDSLLTYDAFYGFEDFKLEGKMFVNTGIGFGSIKQHHILKKMLDDYKKLHFVLDNGKINNLPCPQINSHVFEEFGFVLNGELQVKDNICLLSPEFLCPIQWQNKKCTITEKTISIHYFSASWKAKNKKFFFRKMVKKIIGNKLYNRIKVIFKNTSHKKEKI